MIKSPKIIFCIFAVQLLFFCMLPVYAASGAPSETVSSASSQAQTFSDSESVPDEVMDAAISNIGESFETVIPWILLSLVVLSIILVLLLLAIRQKV